MRFDKTLIFIFLISFFQPIAKAQDQSQAQCSISVESNKNIYRVCLQKDEEKSVVILFRYLGSGEVEREKYLLDSIRVQQEIHNDVTTSFIAKSLDDEELVRAKDFALAPREVPK